MVIKNKCEFCERQNCHGECQNYILDMIDAESGRLEFEKLFKQIPKFNYILTAKISSIFGTDLEVSNKSSVNKAKTEEFDEFLYKTNENGNTNLSEIKRAVKEKEIFGLSYIFFDDKNRNVYFIDTADITVYKKSENNPVIDNILYYTIGNPDITEDEIKFKKNENYILDDEGYIVKPKNIIKFSSDSFVLNSDLIELQTLIEINRKIYLSTTKRDYGDLYFFTSKPATNPISAVANRIKNTTEDVIKKLRESFALLIKANKTEDSNVAILDEQYEKVEQVEPLTTVKDYQFFWEKTDDIMTSVMNFPAILADLGDASGNISKEALIKNARANFLTPIKSDTANALSVIAVAMFGDGFYLRFKDYETEEL